MKKNSELTGRLKKALHPKAQKIVFPKKDKTLLLAELNTLATLNEAHAIALNQSNLIPLLSTQKILNLISQLRKNNFSVLLNKKISRGTYLLLENYLIEKLGDDVVGSLHIGRSRNDINAAIFKINLRVYFKSIYDELSNLRSTLLKNAKKYIDVIMPIYSQYQVAQVGSYGYYLLAIEEALARDQRYLRDLFFSLDECPMGAGAGCGTSFAIDFTMVASLLGFSKSHLNALDAVADRDVAVRVASVLSTISMHVSRAAQDYQLWTTQEFSFFHLPDNLCGGSSMMPQKKNPYLLEIIKGRSSSVNGLLAQMLTAMHNVPFSNSMEVGTEALNGLSSVSKDIADVMMLFNLFIDHAIPIRENMIHSIRKGFATATHLAEVLVKRKKYSFKKAHYEIGSRIREVLEGDTCSFDRWLKKLNIKEYQRDGIDLACLNEYGAGPAEKSVRYAYDNAKKRLQEDCNWFKNIEKRWLSAVGMLQKAINSFNGKRAVK